MMLNSFFFLYSIVDQTLVMSLLVFVFFFFLNETIYYPKWHISSHLGRITQFSCYKHEKFAVFNLNLFNECFYDY